MLRMKFAILAAALGLAAACANVKPANDANRIDIGSGKSPQTDDAGAGTPTPVDTTGTPKPDVQGTGGVPQSTPKPGGGSTGAGAGSSAPG